MKYAKKILVGSCLIRKFHKKKQICSICTYIYVLQKTDKRVFYLWKTLRRSSVLRNTSNCSLLVENRQNVFYLRQSVIRSAVYGGLSKDICKLIPQKFNPYWAPILKNLCQCFKKQFSVIKKANDVPLGANNNSLKFLWSESNFETNV